MMTMRGGSHAVVALLAVAALAAPAAADRFAEHPVQLYQGPVVLPDFEGAEADWRDLRTRLTAGAEPGVNFAGHFAIVQVGCGMGCTWGVAVDVATGSILSLPISGEEFRYIGYFTEPASNLLKVTWSEGYDPDARCMIGEYLLEGETFRELRVYEHPVYEDCLE